jgi:hypothetical protein
MSFLTSYGKSSQHVSRSSNVIKLTTLVRLNKGKELDDSSSAYHLADVESGLVYDTGHVQYAKGVHTVICSRKSVSVSHNNMSGIFVQNDTLVEVNHV